MSGNRKPLVGMTVWHRALPTYLGEKTDLFTLGTEYVAAIEKHGVDVVLIPGTGSPEHIIDRLDGVVLSGGEDIHPSRWGGVEQNAQAYDPARDATELALYHLARERKLPVLAICRGMQLVGVAEGVKLIPDIAQSTAHPGQSTPAELMNHRHEVSINPGSRLRSIYGASRRMTNSIHHQAIETVPAGFIESAVAEDGTIEAIESEDGLVLAVQWHPEKMTAPRETESEAALFAAFADACATQTATQQLSERTEHK
jgi:putative glutamine amidotransferase